MKISGAKALLLHCFAAATLTWLSAALSATAAEPLPQAHSHNDYEHARPLLDALSHGFWSVEADIWLTNSQLLVAHDLEKAAPGNTLEKLYLDPLQSFLRTNSSAVKSAGPITLLIDVKSDATNTWRALREVLSRYTNILTRFDQGQVATNALTIILSGNRATSLLETEAVRYAGIDGRLPDLELNPSPALMPLVSDNWTKFFQWRGKGPLPAEEAERLKAFITKAHDQGRRIRLWAAPDTPNGWSELKKAGVDLINTDHLPELAEFLRSR